METRFNTRTIATKILFKVIENKRSLMRALPETLKPYNLPQKDQSLVKSICYGVLRNYFYLSHLTKFLLHRPIPNKDRDIQILLLVGLYQILYTRIPEYAAVAETVRATKFLHKHQSGKLVNAVLRNFLRKKDEILGEIKNPAKYANARWITKIIQQTWPDDWETIIKNCDLQPPMHIRVNIQKTTREDYLQLLQDVQIDAIKSELSPVGITLTNPVDITSLPHFNEGWISVQDVAAQMVPFLMDLEPNLTVLDACSAPGGKTAHILETETQLAKLIALDHDQKRTSMTQANLERIGYSAELITGDATNVNDWWDQTLFDRILLDAPCSAFGVIRRHPDIKILRRPTDIDKLAEKQLQIINALWQTLRTGGILLYSTCSILPQENDLVLKAFLNEHNDAKTIAIELKEGKATEFGWQLFPTPNGSDGFYYAKIQKA